MDDAAGLVVSVEFDYDGRRRVVDNVSWREHDSTGRKVLVGLEIIVDGELVAQTVKRYIVGLIRDLRFVDPDECLALRDGSRPSAPEGAVIPAPWEE